MEAFDLEAFDNLLEILEQDPQQETIREDNETNEGNR